MYKLAPSIDKLYVLVFERWVDKALADALAQGDLMERPADSLIKYSYVIGRWVGRGSDSFWRDVRDNPLVADVLSAARSTGYLQMKRYMDEGVAAGVFRPASTAFLAHAVWLAAAASRDPDVTGRLGLTSDEALSEIGHLIVHGMLPCSTPIHGECVEV